MPRTARWSMPLLGLALPLLVTGTASASVHLELGGRLGYGIPLQGGTAGVGDSLESEIAGQIPLWLDLGVRIRSHVFVGGYFSYGPGIPGKSLTLYCDQLSFGFVEDSCSSRDIRAGTQIIYYFLPQTKLDPWIGASWGFEWEGWDLEAHVPGGPKRSISVTGNGTEYFTLHLGLNYALGEHFKLGPFGTLALSQFRDRSVSCRGACNDVELPLSYISTKTLHEWLFLGVRGSFLL